MRRGRLLVLASVAAGGCFGGEYLRHTPCAHDFECGPRTACVEGFCGGPRPGATGTGTEADESSTTEPEGLCEPGVSECVDADTLRTCEADGESYTEVACVGYQICADGRCEGPCEQAAENHASSGCSFTTVFSASIFADNNVVSVVNTESDRVAHVEVLWVPVDGDEPAPLETHELAPLSPAEPGVWREFTIDFGFPVGEVSNRRQGGVLRIESDVPLVAVQRQPADNGASPESSLLLPDHALGQTVVVHSYPGFRHKYWMPGDREPEPHGRPSQVTVVALEDATRISWTTPAGTDGNNASIPAVWPGGQGMMDLDRFEVVQLAALTTEPDKLRRDVSGTVIRADRSIWAMGVTSCADVPVDSLGFCDSLQEQLIPVTAWGETYVGAPAPPRHIEDVIWRVYAGADGVTVATDPPVDGTPIVLETTGEYRELRFNHGTAVVFRGTGPFMPVQYLVGSADGADGLGDPAMVAATPVEQFTTRQVFFVFDGFELDYVQVVRAAGGEPVLLDGRPLSGFLPVGAYEYLDVPVTDGAHVLASASPFGFSQFGYTIFGSYAHPGGMSLAPISTPQLPP